MLKYAIELVWDTNDTWQVICPDLPELNSFGETKEEAMHYAKLAVEEVIACRLAHFEDIPKPKAKTDQEVTVCLQLALKVLTKWRLEEAGLTRLKLAQQMGKDLPQIDRLFDPARRSGIDQYEQAIRAMGGAFEVSVVNN